MFFRHRRCFRLRSRGPIVLRHILQRVKKNLLSGIPLACYFYTLLVRIQEPLRANIGNPLFV